MSQQDQIELLKGVELFRDLKPEDLARLAAAAAVRSFSAQETVVSAGDPADALYVVLDGEFQVYVRQPELEFEKEIRRLRTGDAFGEIAVFTGEGRTAHVRALTAARVLAVGRGAVEDTFRGSPEFGFAVCRRLARYVSELTEGEGHFRLLHRDAIATDEDLASLIPARVAIMFQAIVVGREGDDVTVGMVDPYQSELRGFINEVLSRFRVRFAAILPEDFEVLCGRFLEGSRADAVERVAVDDLFVVSGPEDNKPLSLGPDDLLARSLAKALELGASDVHFEPTANAGRVRMRVDGRLLPIENDVKRETFSRAVSRLLVLNNLDISRKHLPQDGSCHFRAGERSIETRTSLLPSREGETVVLRVLNPLERSLDLRSLILSAPLAQHVREMFLSPSGLLLVSGPTGGGKTTTLYAGLHEIWNASPTVKISTVEDPVEYRLDFATQAQVSKPMGLTFADLLRSIMRQDPDVILVGEVRDPESAQVALRAAVTGHLVLSSMHGYFALESVAALRNFGVPPYLLATALRGVICQQLLPRVCASCRAPVAPDDANVAWLRANGLLEGATTAEFVSGRGCEACRFQGARGRVGLFEVLTASEALRDRIEANASWTELNAALDDQSFVSSARYARFLLGNKLVSPSSVREAFPGRLVLQGAAL